VSRRTTNTEALPANVDSAARVAVAAYALGTRTATYRAARGALCRAMLAAGMTPSVAALNDAMARVLDDGAFVLVADSAFKIRKPRR